MALTPDQVAEMAYLSWLAYDDQHCDVQTVIDQDGGGWTALGRSELDPAGTANPLPAGAFDSDGYYVDGNAAALVAVKGDTLTVAVRGSDESADYSDALHDQFGHFQRLVPLLDKVFAYLSAHTDTISHLYVTGHSLGGAMAQYFAQSYPVDTALPDGIDVKIATFGSPGTPLAPTTPLARTIVNFGHTQDYIFEHDLGVGGAPGTYQALASLALVSETPDQVNAELGDLNRVGTNIAIDAPNTDWKWGNLTVLDGYAALVGEHAEEMYGRSIDSFANSIFTARFLAHPDDHKLIVDTLYSPPGGQVHILDNSAEIQPLFIVGDSGLSADYPAYADDDLIRGGAAGDWIDGGIGADKIFGKEGPDWLYGGSGSDVLNGNSGNDSLVGAGGADLLSGGGGHDKLRGGGRDDTLNGDGWGDRLYGGAGSDRLNGGAGNDTLSGDNGGDALKGLLGADVLIGGGGDDRLFGGKQADIFVFADHFGNDTIADFKPGNLEQIDLSGVSDIAAFADLAANHLETDTGTGFALIVDGADTILLNNILVSQIGAGHAYSAADFIF